MQDNTLEKFVTNMRAAGQSDEMIANSLIGAGHNELFVLNALGVEHMSQLTDDDIDDEPVASALPGITGAFDENGNPLIDPNAPPVPVAATPAPVAKKPPASRLRPNKNRTYQRPSSRRVSEISPKKPPVARAKEKVAEEPKTPPQIIKGRPLAVNKRSPYQHHTYDDFLGRTQDRKEIESGIKHSHALEPGYERQVLEDYKKLPSQKKLKESPPTNVGPKDIDELLTEQKEEASAGPSGPDITDLLDEKDLEDLQSTPEIAPPPKPHELSDVPDIPQIQQVGSTINDIRSSLALKVVVILIGVSALVGLAASIIARITG